MQLRTKFFISALVIALISLWTLFLFPRYAIMRGINGATKEVSALVREDNRRLFDNQRLIASDLFVRLVRHIKVFFLLFEQIPEVQKTLTFPSLDAPVEKRREGLEHIWYTLANLSSQNPNLGMLQLDSEDGKQHALLTPVGAHVYAFRIQPSSFPQIIQVVRSDEKYLGLPFHAGYVLISATAGQEEVATWQKHIKQFEEQFQWPREYDIKRLFFDSYTKEAEMLEWFRKTQLLRFLAPLVASSLVENPSLVPLGMIVMEQPGEAYGVLTAEAMHVQPMMDAAVLYANNLPDPGAPPMTRDISIVASPSLQHLFVTGTLKTSSSYLSIGLELDLLAKQLALWTGKAILVQTNDQAWVVELPQAGMPLLKPTHADLSGLLGKKNGEVEVDTSRYLFSTLLQLDNGRIVFYELSPVGAVDPFQTFMAPIAQRLASRLAWTFFAISISMVVLILVFVAIMAFINAIIPARFLAQATQEVAKGHYDAVRLPAMGRRKDEMAVLVHSFGEMVQGLQDKEKIRSVLDKVVSKEIAQEILRSEIQLGGEDRQLSVLFADIRGFTSMTEKMTPQQTIGMLNKCMTTLTQIIEEQNGVVDKYMGDEVMALYGAPIANPKNALRAVSTAVMMMKAFRTWNVERVAHQEPTLHLGIGVHSGVAVAGNMGAEDRLNYTVLGANVNLAARLCQSASEDQVLISHETLHAPGVQEAFVVAQLPAMMLKGFKEPVTVYQVIDFKSNDDT